MEGGTKIKSSTRSFPGGIFEEEDSRVFAHIDSFINGKSFDENFLGQLVSLLKNAKIVDTIDGQPIDNLVDLLFLRLKEKMRDLE